MNFWDKLFSEKRMVLGLSPMDGVTDAVMRYMTARYSARNNQSPNSNNQTGGVDLLFTEFVSVDALHYATAERRERLLKTFLRASEVIPNRETPPTFGVPTWPLVTSPVEESPFPYEIAQVFGHTPDLFAEAAELIESLGFDGIDINMGCPMHKVEDQGSGAGLIRTPAIAQEIVKTVKAHTSLPVSVKTRIGVDRDVAEEWMETLMEVKPANISLHGRTLRQLYQGRADWEAIGRAAAVVHKYGGHILGNGDVESVEDARAKVAQYGLDGVLIGRAAEGNPGVFLQGSVLCNECRLQRTDPCNPCVHQRLAWMVEHAKVFENIFVESTLRESPLKSFMPMRKHLAWYCKGFEGAVEMRSKLMQCNSSEEVQQIIASSRAESRDLDSSTLVGMTGI